MKYFCLLGFLIMLKLFNDLIFNWRYIPLKLSRNCMQKGIITFSVLRYQSKVGRKYFNTQTFSVLETSTPFQPLVSHIHYVTRSRLNCAVDVKNCKYLNNMVLLFITLLKINFLEGYQSYQTIKINHNFV